MSTIRASLTSHEFAFISLCGAGVFSWDAFYAPFLKKPMRAIAGGRNIVLRFASNS